MRNLLLLLLCIIPGMITEAQDLTGSLEGSVTYITSQSVYVKFPSTARINSGDTLSVMQAGKPIQALVVKDLSSTSCVCTPVLSIKLSVADRIIFIPKNDRPSSIPVTPLPPLSQVQADTSSSAEITMVPEQAFPVKKDSPVDTTVNEKPALNKRKATVNGYFQVASYSNFSNLDADFNQRMKYTLSLNLKNIGGSGLSAETYMCFVHSNTNWDQIQSDLFNGLKIYNLSLNYEFNKTFRLWFGRKVNPKVSNMGAVDGLQFEMRFRPLTVGIIAGSRPDYRNYGFNFNLLQFGAYLFNEFPTRNGPVQTTLAFIQQNNDGKTDRRFVYLQHANSLIKNLTFFGSVEFDFYRQVLTPEDSSFKQNNSPKLSNLYLSLNYRILQKATISLSYSARQNVIYYETYKNFLDKLLDTETLQGYSLQVNYRPVKNLTIGASGAYRFQKNDPRSTKNASIYITYNQIPWLGVAMTGSFTWLETAYLTGKVYSLGISRDLAAGKLFAGLNYRYVDYRYSSLDMGLPQNMAEVNLTWRIYRKISFSVYYEGTFEKINSFNRLYAQLHLGF